MAGDKNESAEFPQNLTTRYQAYQKHRDYYKMVHRAADMHGRGDPDWAQLSAADRNQGLRLVENTKSPLLETFATKPTNLSDFQKFEQLVKGCVDKKTIQIFGAADADSASQIIVDKLLNCFGGASDPRVLFTGDLIKITMAHDVQFDFQKLEIIKMDAISETQELAVVKIAKKLGIIAEFGMAYVFQNRKAWEIMNELLNIADTGNQS